MCVQQLSGTGNLKSWKRLDNQCACHLAFHSGASDVDAFPVHFHLHPKEKATFEMGQVCMVLHQ